MNTEEMEDEQRPHEEIDYEHRPQEEMEAEHISLAQKKLMDMAQKAFKLQMDIHTKELYCNALKEELSVLKPEVALLKSNCNLKRLEVEHKAHIKQMVEETLERYNELISTKEILNETLQENFEHVQRQNERDAIQAKLSLEELESVQLKAKHLFEQEPLAIKVKDMKNNVLWSKIKLAMIQQQISEQNDRNKLMKKIRNQLNRLQIVTFAKCMVNYYRIQKNKEKAKQTENMMEIKIYEKEIRDSRNQRKQDEIKMKEEIEVKVFKIPILKSLTPEDKPTQQDLKRRITEPDHSVKYKKMFTDLNLSQTNLYSKPYKHILNISIETKETQKGIEYELSTKSKDESKCQPEMSIKETVTIHPIIENIAPLEPKIVSSQYGSNFTLSTPSNAPETVSPYYFNEPKSKSIVIEKETFAENMIVENYESQQVNSEEFVLSSGTMLSSNTDMHTAPQSIKQPSEVGSNANDIDMVQSEYCYDYNAQQLATNEDMNFAVDDINQEGYGHSINPSPLPFDVNEMLKSPSPMNLNYKSPDASTSETSNRRQSMFEPKPPQGNDFKLLFGGPAKPKSGGFFNMF